MAKMNHLKKKSLLTKYESLVQADASPVEAKNTITEAEKDLLPEHVDELIEVLFGLDPAPERQKEMAPDPEEENVHPMLKGKKHYDIFRGQWWPIESVTGFDGKDHVVLWEFRPEGKAVKTGVPMEPNKADEFNVGKRLRAARTYTEQMILVGSEGKIYDELPDPTARRRINS